MRQAFVHCVAGVLALGSFAAAAEPEAAATDAQVALAAGKRSIAIHVRTTTSYRCDRFSVQFQVCSGMTTPDLVAGRIETMADHIQDALRIAGVPAATLDGAASSPEPIAGAGGKLATFASYRVAVTSADQGRAVQAVLAPFTIGGNTVSDVATVTSSRVEARSAKVLADRDGAIAEVRLKALAAARAEAEQNAKALNMRVGPPLSIGAIEVTQASNPPTTEESFFAAGTVLFELVE